MSTFCGRFATLWGVYDVVDLMVVCSGSIRSPFVEYFRSISGEHDDWDEYRQAMEDQGKCIILVEPTHWSPLNKGGFPPELFGDR